MKLRFILALLFFSQAYAVVGGKRIERHTGPEAAVAKLFPDTGFCSGTLIAPQVVLTAAHCLPEDYFVARNGGHPGHYRPHKMIVRLRDQDDNQYDLVASSFLVPDEYSPSQWYGGGTPLDIALVYLDEPMTKIKPISLGESETLIPDKGSVLFSGYGLITGDPLATISDSGFLQQIILGHIENKDLFFRIFEPKTGVCLGDSGGPALVEQDGVTYVVGVLSFSDPHTAMTPEELAALIQNGKEDWDNLYRVFPHYDECAGGHSIFVSVPKMNKWIKKNLTIPE